MWSLLAATGDLTVLIAYAFYAIVIFVGLALIGVFKKREKRLLTAETVKKRCGAAAKFATQLIEHKAGVLMLPTARLARLSSMISDAEWLALRLVEEKKDIVFDGIAKDLDSLATEVSNKSAEPFISAKELTDCLEKARKKLNATVNKLETLIAHREGLLEV